MSEMKRPDPRANADRAGNVEVATTDGYTVPRGEDIPVQLRRRRAASLRLPPLADGLRDPWLAARPPLSAASARAAWAHLHALGLMSEHVNQVLRKAARDAA